MTDELRNKVKDWMAFWNTGDATLADELYADDYVRHDPTTPGSGPELIKAYVGMVREGFPDLRFVLEESIIEADRVCARWSATGTFSGPLLGLEPTGKKVVFSGADILHFRGGKIYESWPCFDQLTMYQQAGLLD